LISFDVVAGPNPFISGILCLQPVVADRHLKRDKFVQNQSSGVEDHLLIPDFHFLPAAGSGAKIIAR
jgi:hypothetical protein